MSVYSYVGKGKIYLRVRGSGDPLRFVGNSSQLNFSVAEQTIDLLDFTQGGGGKDDVVRRPESVTASMIWHNLSPENLAVALFGASTSIPGAAVVGENQTANLGGLVRTDNVPDPSAALTVDTYVEGVDFERVPSGIIPLASGSILEGETLSISYTALGSAVIEALLSSGDEYQLVFDGINEAKSDRSVIVTAHRVKFSPVQDMAMIGNEFAGLNVTAELLKDDAIQGSSLSKFMKIEMAEGV